ncbi:MAG: dihydrofolate reductase family protein [Thermoguttaceae bacterium]
MKTSMYVAISIDGFIAKKDGSIDWLNDSDTEENAQNQEAKSDCGYNVFLDSVDVLVFGGKTYRQLLTFGDWPYPHKKCVIVSRKETQTNLPNVSFTNDSPEMIVQRLENEGFQHLWVMGGGEIHTMFLNANVIDEMRIFVIPKILGEGIPLFAPPLNNLYKEDRWELFNHQHWHSDIVELHYRHLPKQPLNHETLVVKPEIL